MVVFKNEVRNPLKLGSLDGIPSPLMFTLQKDTPRSLGKAWGGGGGGGVQKLVKAPFSLQKYLYTFQSKKKLLIIDKFSKKNDLRKSSGGGCLYFQQEK